MSITIDSKENILEIPRKQQQIKTDKQKKKK